MDFSWFATIPGMLITGGVLLLIISLVMFIAMSNKKGKKSDASKKSEEGAKNMVNEMVEARKKANKIEDERSKAIAYHDPVVPYFDQIRYHIDKLELMVDNEMWPLPKYRELLFIR